MKKLSIWGKNNPRKARIIIALSHVLLVVSAFFLGLLTFVYDLALPIWLPIVLAHLFFVAYLLYPDKQAKKGVFAHSYLRQKTTDFVLTITYILAIAAGLNQWAFAPTSGTIPVEAKGILMAQKIKPTEEAAGHKKSKFSALKTPFQELKSQLKTLRDEFKAAGDKEGAKGTKILLFLLTFVVALGLAWLVAALACNISCSGQEGLAWVALILGLAGVVWLTIISVKAISRKTGKKDLG